MLAVNGDQTSFVENNSYSLAQSGFEPEHVKQHPFALVGKGVLLFIDKPFILLVSVSLPSIAGLAPSESSTQNGNLDVFHK